MYYPLSSLWHFLLQITIFVYNFYSGENFCGEKICGNFILWELIFADREKNRKIAKIRTRKNLVPHGIQSMLKLGNSQEKEQQGSES